MEKIINTEVVVSTTEEKTAVAAIVADIVKEIKIANS
jgi:hypothetical protein